MVYRAGPMAMLGHDHVIVNRTLGGWVRYAGTVPEASFALTVPAAGFVVDDDGARREEGADFAEETPEEAKSGTMRNMQSPAVLDSAEFPEITVRSVTVTGAQGELEATVAVSVAGHESTLRRAVHLGNVSGPAHRQRGTVGAPIRSRFDSVQRDAGRAARTGRHAHQIPIRRGDALTAAATRSGAEIQAADSVKSRMVVPSGAVIMAAGSCRSGGGT